MNFSINVYRISIAIIRKIHLYTLVNIYRLVKLIVKTRAI